MTTRSARQSGSTWPRRIQVPGVAWTSSPPPSWIRSGAHAEPASRSAGSPRLGTDPRISFALLAVAPSESGSSARAELLGSLAAENHPTRAVPGDRAPRGGGDQERRQLL